MAVAILALLVSHGDSIGANRAPAPRVPSFLVFVKEAKAGAQPTHRVAPKATIELGLVGDNSRARFYSVCLSGKGLQRCWRRVLSPYQDVTRVSTRAPRVPGAYTVTWTLAKHKTKWSLRVARSR